MYFNFGISDYRKYKLEFVILRKKCNFSVKNKVNVNQAKFDIGSI